MKKMHFPRLTLPSIVLGSCMLNNFLLFIAMLGVFILLDQQFSMAMLWLLPLTLILATLALSIGLIVGILNVFVRDIGQVVPIVLQMMFWFTPIVYPVSIIPEQYRHWLDLNPMYTITSAYHNVLVYGKTPNLDGIATIGIISLALLLFSLLLFSRSSEDMVDVL